MDRVFALILTLAAGALVAFQPPSNAALAHHVGDLGAALVSLLISTVLLDRFAVLGLRHVPLDWERGLGVALIIAGALLITSR